MQKRILTMFWYDDITEAILYKDVGGIPYALSKYCGWQATFAYNNANGLLHNEDYEKYVFLSPITFNKYFKRIKSRYIRFFPVIKYIFKNAKKYDVINFYHCHEFTNFLCWFAKIMNPQIITYVKLDMDKDDFKYQKERHMSRRGGRRWRNTDIFTTETLKYVVELNKLKKFNNKVKYLPNGFFADLEDIDLSKIKKEKIILTVGRLGTYQKNTELLIESLIEIEDKLNEWIVYLVGPMTEDFEIWLNKRLVDHSKLKNKIVITGNIIDKKELYQIYAKSSIFVLPSRYEGFPLVIQEAMHFACYPIVTNCFPAADEVIRTGENGFGDIVNQSENDLNNVLKSIKIINYLEKGQKAAEFINENFDWKILAKKLENYFLNSKTTGSVM